MKRILTICIVSMLLLLNCFTISTATSENKTIYVDDDGTADYTSIQDAVDAASDGDTVFVYPGVYYESIFIDKQIQLLGENKYDTIINSTNGDSYPISISYPKVRVEGFTLLDAEDLWEDTAAIVVNADETCIEDCIIITNLSYGIFLHQVEKSSICANYITSIHAAIKLTSSTNNNISYNQLVGGQGQHGYSQGIPFAQFYGIKAESSNRNTISNNHIAGNGIGLSMKHCNFNTITMNNFINDGTTTEIGGKTIILFSSNVDTNPSLSLNFWDSNYWDDWYGILPFQMITGLFPLTFGDFLRIDWNPVNVPFDIQ